MDIWLSKELEQYFSDKQELFDTFMFLRGDLFREREGRCTQHLTLNGNQYFIKRFSALSWKTLIKNFLSLKFIGFHNRNEYLALQRLKQIKIDVPEIKAYGRKSSFNPTKTRSFILMESLLEKTVSLTDYCNHWIEHPPSFRIKYNIINQVASIAKKLHDNGVIHQDLYFHHLLLDTTDVNQTIKIYLIDFHRAFIKKNPRSRWIVKDLAGLYCSSLFSVFSRNDIFRFLKTYFGLSLRDILQHKKPILVKVKNRGENTYQMELEKKRKRQQMLDDACLVHSSETEQYSVV